MLLLRTHAKYILITLLLCAATLLVMPMHAQAEDATPPYGTVGGCTWKIDSGGKLTIAPDPGGTGYIEMNSSSPWYDYRLMITEVKFEKGVKAKNVKYPNTALLVNMFNGCSNLKSIDFSDFDTSEVSNMSGMFDGCSSLTQLDLSGFYTPHLANVAYMFSRCTPLAYLDISNLDTTNVSTADSPFPDYSAMFMSCSSLIKVKIGPSFTLCSQLPGSCWKNDETDASYDFTDDHYTSFGKGDAGTYTLVPTTDEAASGSSTTTTGSSNATSSSTTKVANKITKAVTSKTFKYSKVKKKAQSFKVAAKVKGKAKVTYKVSKYLKKGKITAKKVKKYVKVSSAGKVTVKKGAPKGTYKLKVKITAAATSAYKKTSVTKTITIKVK